MDKIAREHIEKEIEKTAEVIKKGGVILYPTDTIWGLGCDPFNPSAIQKIFKIKQRLESKSMIILIHSADAISKYVKNPIPIAFDLIDKWQKPLTVVFPRAINLKPPLVNEEDNSIAIRVSKERFTYHLLKYMDAPIISTSANLSGMPSPIHFKDVFKEIKDQVDYIVDYRRNIMDKIKPSTIIKIDDNGSFQVLRP